jgi:hypothetical protein
MIPANPGELPLIGAQARRGVEVIALCQHLLLAGGEIDGTQQIVDVASVILAYGDQTVALRVENEVGET